MKAKKHSTKKGYRVRPELQKFFIVLAALSIVIQVATILYWALRQYPSNSNFSAFLLPAVDSFIVPVIMFLSAYYLVPQRDRGSRIFESLLLMTMGLLASGILSQMTMLAYTRFVTIGSGYWESVAYDLGGSAVALLLYTALLLRYRRSA
jgi:hypothetical protein